MKKILFSGKTVAVAFVLATSTFIYTAIGAPPASQYSAGETTAPSCAPGDANCSVNVDLKLDDTWVGLGATAGRVEFDDQVTDEFNILDSLVGIGTSTPTQLLDLVGEGDADIDLTTYENGGSDNSTVHFNFANGTIALPVIVNDGELIGGIKGRAWDGLAFETIGEIQFLVDGTMSTTSSPGEIRFRTVANSSQSTTTQMIIRGDGRVGVGTTSPSSSAQMEIQKSGGGDVLRLDGSSGSISSLVLETSSASNSARFTGETKTGTWGTETEFVFFTGGLERMRINGAGQVGIGTATPHALAMLDVNGTIYQRGGVLHADYVFQDDYVLESISDHAEFMWANNHLPAVSPAEYDEDGQEIVNIGDQRRGILEELEKAHVYIEQLNSQLNSQKEEMQLLKDLVCVDMPNNSYCK